jgi:hypothetical protein
MKPIEPIEIAHLLDEGAVPIQEHGAPHLAASRRRTTADRTASTVIPFMQR